MKSQRQRNRKRGKSRRRAMVLADPNGNIRFADSSARRWLREFFSRPRRSAVLPEKIRKWLARRSSSSRRRSLIAAGKQAHLYIKEQDSYTRDLIILLLELTKGKRDERARRHRTLTPREREVLFWVSQGKSNAEIGLILGIAGATVGKHLERAYAKLGVENRMAAAAYIVENQES